MVKDKTGSTSLQEEKMSEAAVMGSEIYFKAIIKNMW